MFMGNRPVCRIRPGSIRNASMDETMAEDTMALTKKFLKTKPVCKVGFKLSGDKAQGAKHAAVAGEFNDWLPKPMRKLKDGSFSVTLDLEAGREYQFRYVIDKQYWVNDEAADGYVFSDYAGGDNSVVAC